MSKIVSIGTALPAYCHRQSDILQFMQLVYASNDVDRRKLRFLYSQGGIDQRYSVIGDYSRPAADWKFYPQTENLEPFPSLETRMALFNRFAPQLSVDAIRNCLEGVAHAKDITHLITVSCTGMSAPGLDLQVMELLDLPKNIMRTSVNFMGCYAAIHALKLGDAFCRSDKDARVLIVCTELCTLHFQREGTMDNIASSLLFGDGSAAVLMMGADATHSGLQVSGFHSEVLPNGKRDMAWELSSSGFLMTLSGYVPELIEEDLDDIIERGLQRHQMNKADISHWCIHPGGKRILEAITKSVGLQKEQLQHSYQVLQEHGNMSSATILFVLKRMLQEKPAKLFGAAFGPGLTVETFMATS
ncbi:Predicted naringenin-chalcone synthase [Cnuella takakiae]|uniref:Predicted naringenin-chalcone synthase n=1 Tax=Cnuella takakiae TaxID=1302690 RepID=A0A1M4WM86_9BACT|nr:type III polyketide synthase [Cnuella takakiae]OLY91677.1 naringenin-chalcone synthase [Cnuella takakiae]SHE82369.1 Predicted naringenin-chalcone synthase [Cnuella takakiae]